MSLHRIQATESCCGHYCHFFKNTYLGLDSKVEQSNGKLKTTFLKKHREVIWMSTKSNNLIQSHYILFARHLP